MSTQAPKIDGRTAAEVSARLTGTAEKTGLLEEYTRQPPAPAPGYPFAPWHEYDPTSFAPRGRSAALIGIFARLAEILIECLNRVPEKNFLAFLDLLGAERLPPQPAQVPLTFTLAAGSVQDAEVLPRTQVAAPPPPGAKEPVVFETERALTVTAARLDALLTLDPLQDSDGDWSGCSTSFPIFAGDRAAEHCLYLGDERLLAYPQIKNLSVDISLAASLSGADQRTLHWERWDGTHWQPLAPTADPTGQLTAAGLIEFGPLLPLPECMVNLRTSRWLRCRLTTPITRSPIAVAGMVHAADGQLPSIAKIITAVSLERPLAAGIAPDLGFTNGVPLVLSKEFFPFGEQPRLYDSWSLASAEAFSRDSAADLLPDPGAYVELGITLANSHLIEGGGSVRPAPDVALAWESWDGSAWQKVGTSAAPAWLALLELDPAAPLKTDGEATYAIVQGTAAVGAQVTSSMLGDDGASTGKTYLSVGADGRFADQRLLGSGVNVVQCEASYLGRACKAWTVVSLGNDQVALLVTAPELPVDEDQIQLTVEVTGADRALVQSLRVTNGNPSAPSTPPQPPGTPLTVPVAAGRNALLIEALDQSGQRRLAAAAVTVSRAAKAPASDAGGFSDGTFGLTQSGVVTLRLPTTRTTTAVNGQEGFWLRVRIVKGNYGKEASYVLKDPVKPQDGFTLVPASFRPPIVAALRIGYQATLRRSPPVCLTYNQRGFTDCTAAARGAAAPFPPFVAATEAQRPGLYLGFSLPLGRLSFPHNALSLYSRLADVRYGERAVPLAPETSRGVGAAGASVRHRFTITNAAAQTEVFDITLLGYGWAATVVDAIPPVTIPAGATRSFAVQVSIPGGTATGASDRGFVRISKRSEPERIATAIFTTAVERFTSTEPVAVAWQYWDGTQWAKLTVQDEAENFTRSGLIEFLPPADLARRDLFGLTRYWLRAQWDKGDYQVPPRLALMLPNTTLARQVTSVVNEVLGSGSGAKGQQFKATRVPVLAGQRLEVREPELPGADDLRVLTREEGADAVTRVTDATGRPREIWVRWHEVPDFYGSGPHDRHYVINHLSGAIRFGDGVNGRVPPPGTSNLRLARYQTGGGPTGNSAAGTVAQLKTTVPYVDKVANPVAATGGAAAETTAALLSRMPRTLRHLDRAVTLEDYEDLAQIATTEVARARCVPLRDLAADPLGKVPQRGSLSLIVVPRCAEAKPLPTLELLTRVRTFLAARADATASLVVVGPQYVRVDVHAEVAVASLQGASAVERAVYDRLAAFLHPLTGGLDGQGWDFGRAPHRSDFFAVIESVPGVDHCRYLDLIEQQDEDGVRQTGRFLVFSGNHQISLVFAGN